VRVGVIAPGSHHVVQRFPEPGRPVSWAASMPSPGHSESCPTASESERGAGFQREMSLKSGAKRSLGDDRDVTLRTERIRTLDQIRTFLEGNEPAGFEALDYHATATTPLDASKAVQRARDELFRAIGKATDSVA